MFSSKEHFLQIRTIPFSETALKSKALPPETPHLKQLSIKEKEKEHFLRLLWCS